jgi:hypothetical protein
MRWIVRLVLPLAVVGVLAAGLLPPLVAKGRLATEALDAARAASAAVTNSGNQQAAYQAAAKWVAAGSDHNVQLVSVNVQSGQLGATVQVTLRESVHTFMEDFPGLKGWFRISTTQESSLGQ